MKPKYKWRDREKHFAWLRYERAREESFKLGINAYNKTLRKRAEAIDVLSGIQWNIKDFESMRSNR